MRSRALAGNAGGEDEFAGPEADGGGAREAGENRNIEDADGDDGVDRPGSEDGGDEDCDQEGRKGEDEVVAAHDDLVGERAALGRSKEPERHAQPDTERNGDQRDRDGGAGADQNHGEDVASVLIGAEPVQGAGPVQLVGDVLGREVVGRPDERHEGGENDQRGENEPRHEVR